MHSCTAVHSLARSPYTAKLLSYTRVHRLSRSDVTFTRTYIYIYILYRIRYNHRNTATASVCCSADDGHAITSPPRHKHTPRRWPIHEAHYIVTILLLLLNTPTAPYCTYNIVLFVSATRTLSPADHQTMIIYYNDVYRNINTIYLCTYIIRVCDKNRYIMHYYKQQASPMVFQQFSRFPSSYLSYRLTGRRFSFRVLV